jgi:hypothetical protein
MNFIQVEHNSQRKEKVVLPNKLVTAETNASKKRTNVLRISTLKHTGGTTPPPALGLAGIDQPTQPNTLKSHNHSFKKKIT